MHDLEEYKRRATFVYLAMIKVRPGALLVAVAFILLVGFNILSFQAQKKNATDCPKCESFNPIPASSAVSNDSKQPAKLAGGQRAKAAIVILARNSDIDGLKKTIPQLEAKFNAKYEYPYVFLNDVPFNDRFKREMRGLSSAKMSFGTIPHEHWSYPSWINQTKAAEVREDMRKRNIIYGDSLPYRHMCRYNSGFFFRHPLLDGYDYYWRVEPWVEFYCDMNYDPFVYMKENDIDYGFTIMLPEYIETVPTLWKTVKAFMKENPDVVHPKNMLRMFDDGTQDYNLCHFWSNFEIGNLNFFRSEKYLKYFDYLDKAGGFFYERWGDAPVHSIAAAMMLPKEKIHWFEDIGYFHNPFRNCPVNPALQSNCQCDPKKSVHHGNSCHRRYLDSLLR